MEAIATTPLGERPPWQDLPPELLGLVIQRVPSHASRVRVRAVCRSWRAAARLQPSLPPLLPWLALCDGTFLSLPDGAVHRIPVPSDASRIMSTGGMLFVVHNDGRCSLKNPLSRNTAPRRVNADCFRYEESPYFPAVYDVSKVVMMPYHAVTITKRHRHGHRRHLHGKGFSIRWQRQSWTTVEIQWTPPLPNCAYVVDITLFRRKLYVLVRTHVDTLDLYAMDIIGDDKHASLQRILSTPLDNDEQHRTRLRRYLVASGDRLLMVKQKSLFSAVLPSLLMPTQFEVFEAADLSNGHGQWAKVDTLAGRALFISEGCSKSLPAGGRYVGPQEDCIYFLSERNKNDYRWLSLFSGMYDMRKGTFSPLAFETVVAQDGPGTTSWLFPTYT